MHNNVSKFDHAYAWRRDHWLSIPKNKSQLNIHTRASALFNPIQQRTTAHTPTN